MIRLTYLHRTIILILLAAAVRAQCPNTIVAGPPSTYAGDGQPATAAFLSQPQALALDSSGNLYIADSGNNRIRKVTSDGVIHKVAGPDNLNNPQFVLAAPDGSIYIADSGNNRISRLTADGKVGIVAGTGHPGYSGDNGAALGAELNFPMGMAFDSKGNLYFADTYNSAIRRIDTAGVITTVPATAAQFGLYTPEAVAIAADSTLYIADSGAGYIFQLAPGGTLTPYYDGGYLTPSNLTLLPNGSVLFAEEDLILLNGPSATPSYYARAINPTSVIVAPSGIYYTSTGNVVYRAATATAQPAIFAGRYYTGDAPDNVPAAGPIFGSVSGMVAGPDGSVWLADSVDQKIRRILPDGTQRVVSTGIQAGILALDAAGNLFAAGANSVWKIAADGTSHLFAGGGSGLIPAVGAAATQATSVDLSGIAGVVTDSTGNLYVLSEVPGYFDDLLITRITPSGQLTTIWDSVKVPELAPLFLGSLGFAMDSQGYLLVPTYPGNAILRIATDGSGIVQTLSVPDDLVSFAASPTGEIFYVTAESRIKALKAGATLFNRDVDPTATDFLPGATSSSTSMMINTVLTTPRPGGIPGLVVYESSLTTDAQGNVYYFDSTQNAIRRFPAGSCFSVSAPRLSTVAPIAAQPTNSTSTSTTTTNTGTEYTASLYAPGELISIYGFGLGPLTGLSAQADSNGLVAAKLAGTRVLIAGVPAPILYTSDRQVNAVVPFSLYGYVRGLVQVEYNGVLSDAMAVSMYSSSPIVFTSLISGQPTAVVVNQDGSINSHSNPAAPGSIITFYGSGFGLTTPNGVDGHLATLPLPKPVLPVSVSVDGYLAPVLYAGDAAGIVEGFVQMNVRLPQGTYRGDVIVTVGNLSREFFISVGGASN